MIKNMLYACYFTDETFAEKETNKKYNINRNLMYNTLLFNMCSSFWLKCFLLPYYLVIRLFIGNKISHFAKKPYLLTYIFFYLEYNFYTLYTYLDMACDVCSFFRLICTYIPSSQPFYKFHSRNKEQEDNRRTMKEGMSFTTMTMMTTTTTKRRRSKKWDERKHTDDTRQDLLYEKNVLEENGKKVRSL